RRLARHLDSRRWDFASDAARNLLRLTPKDARGWTALGITEYQRRRYADALESFTAATRLDPESVVPWVCLGDVHRESRGESESLSAYDIALSLGPRRGDVGQKLEGALRRAVAVPPDFEVTLGYGRRDPGAGTGPTPAPL